LDLGYVAPLELERISFFFGALGLWGWGIGCRRAAA